MTLPVALSSEVEMSPDTERQKRHVKKTEGQEQV